MIVLILKAWFAISFIGLLMTMSMCRAARRADDTESALIERLLAGDHRQSDVLRAPFHDETNNR